MLIEVRCDLFREKVIAFHPGLNVVLGDEQATNSIGKSTMLMVIDFIFGGGTFLDHNSDVIEELGHHSYKFCFDFDGSRYYFERETYDEKIIHACNKDYTRKQAMTIAEYCEFLSKKYKTSSLLMTFRSIISPYSRVWGRESLDVKNPLSAAKNQPELAAIDNLIKLFDKFSEIKKSSEDLEEKTKHKKSLSSALKFGHIPKITKSKYEANKIKMGLIKEDLANIKSNLAQKACNLKDLVNKEVLDLKDERDSLVDAQFELESRLRRVKHHLSSQSYIRSKNFETLKTFFPEVNTKKIDDIESFHDGLKIILKNELKKSETFLAQQLAEINQGIKGIDEQIAFVVKSEIENPALIVDQIVKLNTELTNLRQENAFFDKEKSLTKEIKEGKESLAIKRQKISDVICNSINDKLRTITTIVYSKDRKAPRLEIKSSQYTYETFEDTGTGKAYSNLILLDLAIFDLTKLPFLIHDSLLFKNIQNDAVKNIVILYGKQKKQVFAALDEIKKYGREAEKILGDKKILTLDNNNLLYTKDWRSGRAKKKP